MVKRKERGQIWPSLEDGRVVVRMRMQRSAPPLEPTEPVDAYAAYLAWLQVDARAAGKLGLSAHAAA